MISESLVDTLRKEINFLRKQWDTAQKENAQLKEDNRKLRLILLRQPIPIEYTRYDPKRFKSIRELVKKSAPMLTQERLRAGKYDWKWEDMMRYLERRTKRRFDPETISRLCRKLAEDGEIVKTDQGRYTWRTESEV